MKKIAQCFEDCLTCGKFVHILVYLHIFVYICVYLRIFAYISVYSHVSSKDAPRDLLKNERLESFWGGLWLSIQPFLFSNFVGFRYIYLYLCTFVYINIFVYIFVYLHLFENFNEKPKRKFVEKSRKLK